MVDETNPTRPSAAVERVRVVVLNYNGGDLTLRSLRALLATRWPKKALEVVLVDNASSDGVVDAVERELPAVHVVRSTVNRGFAGGNNLGIGDLTDVDAIGLVNNDVTVPPDWLTPLADALRRDKGLGAASPKMLLEGRYRRVDLGTTAEPPWIADPRERGVRVIAVIAPPESPGEVRHVSGFFEPERRGGETFRWAMPKATMFVPVPPYASEPITCTLVLDSNRPKELYVRSGDQITYVTLCPGVHTYRVGLGGETFDVVNNVGSEMLPNGYAADRGWLEPDEGQYEKAEDVFAWCGGAVLLRAGYLRDAGLLDERLFLYYEDLELSWRGRRRGWRYRYLPSSVVRHVHAASTVEDSAVARYYNERNRLLVLARHATLTRLLSAVLRYVFSTGSYVRRDLVAPMLRGERPRTYIVSTRLRSFVGFVVGAPAQLRDRRLTGRSGRR